MCHCYYGETVDHLLLHYVKAYWLWSFVFNTFRISWVLSHRFSIWLVELVGEAFISHLEFSFVVFDVVYLEGTQLADF